MAISVKKRKPEKTLYVYYNEFTCEILSIGRTKRKDIDAPYIKTSSPIAHMILKGKTSSKNYIVDDELNEIVNTSKHEFILNHKSKIDVIMRSNSSKSDLKIIYYERSNIMVFSLCNLLQSRIKSYNTSFEHLYQDFYVVDENNIDRLICKIQISLDELFQTGLVIIEDVYIDRQDFALLTHKLFKTFSLVVSKERFVGFEADNGLVMVDEYDNDCHIAIEKIDGGMVLRTMVSKDQIKIACKKLHSLKFYAVGETVDHLIEGFEVNLNKLIKNQECYIDLNYDFDSVSFVHNTPTLKIVKRKCDGISTN